MRCKQKSRVWQLLRVFLKILDKALSAFLSSLPALLPKMSAYGTGRSNQAWWSKSVKGTWIPILRLHQPLNDDLDVHLNGINIYLPTVTLGFLWFIAKPRNFSCRNDHSSFSSGICWGCFPGETNEGMKEKLPFKKRLYSPVIPQQRPTAQSSVETMWLFRV